MLGQCQCTIQKKVSFSGIGLHRGVEVTLHFLPAEPFAGICFQRVDLEGQPTFPALLEHVQDTSRSTTIGVGECSVQTVEHLLSALAACGIDNLLIQIDGSECPIADGSSLPFIELLEEAGLLCQEAVRKTLVVTEPLYYSEGNCHLIALPSDSYKISYTLHYPHAKMIGSQFFSFPFSLAHFKEEIASARTFVLEEELALLKEKGLIKGGNLENAVVIKEDAILSKGGLRYQNEMVRHKILDVIGDLYLTGAPLKAHIIAICSGHRTNVAFGKILLSHCVLEGEVYERVPAF